MQLVKAADLDMQVITKPPEKEKYVRYRARQGDRYRHKDAARKRKSRAAAIPEFIGVDGEGIGRNENHRYVLLGVGDRQLENDRGLNWREAFEFLYEQFKEHPRAAFVGFYLRYDFNSMLSYKAGFPQNAARMLFTPEGRAQRKIKQKRGYNMHSHPVRVDGWEINMLGMKQLQIRPRPEGCECQEHKMKCSHKSLPMMTICDAGSFFAMSFLKVIHPDTWKQDPNGPVCTMEQYKRIEKGKNMRDRHRLDNDMRAYNVEENLLFSVVMDRLARGFHKVGIRPSKDQWYGPGATASKWLAKEGAVKKSRLRQKDGTEPALIPKFFWDACKRSYFGGWFEIFSHGLITGKSYNYDINNAYPYASTKLPHICTDCKYKRGNGAYKGRGTHVLLYASVYSKSDRIGAMPHRNKAGNILRPSATKGWYWHFEIEAARRAGLVKRVITHEWAEFIPCQHKPPFLEIENLYNLRKSVGKDSAQGMAIKLNNNSIYGKFAQSVGAAPYNNWLYAAYITAHCRAQILDAIATHPQQSNAVLMVATDGVCFDSPHPDLPVSKELGEWSYTEYTDLCLFKPGVYWHKEGREALLKVKSRGVPKDEFIKEIDQVQAKFQRFLDMEQYPGWDLSDAYANFGHDGKAFDLWMSREGWPAFTVHVNFRMKSCAQALNEGNWESSGKVQEKYPVLQDSTPFNKRDPKGIFFNHDKSRIDSTIHTLPTSDIQTYYHKEIVRPKHFNLGYGLDGDAMAPLLEAATILRDKPANYDLPLAEMEWEQVW